MADHQQGLRGLPEGRRVTVYGVIGMGIMGRGIAGTLARTGVGPVLVHSRSPFPSHDGWLPVNDLEELGRQCDLVLLTVPTAEAVREVMAPETGLIAALGPEGVLVNHATVGPPHAIEFETLARDLGVGYVDAPVLGSKEAAASGRLVLLAAGSDPSLARCEPYFHAIGRRTVYLDRVGDASRAKLVFNSVLGMGMAALVEAFHLTRQLGLDPTFLVDEVLASPVASPAMRAKGKAIVDGEHHVHFPLEWMLKDLRLARDAMPEGGHGTLGAAVAVFEAGMREGLAREDYSAVHRVRRPAASQLDQ